MSDTPEVIHTKIWQEVAGDNPFQADTCYCAGYDVFGELINEASWIEYLFLLFKLDPPTQLQASLLNQLAVALANPGPRDASVRASMAASVGGSTAASCLMAALAVGAGKYTGAREVFVCAHLWSLLQTDIDAWSQALAEKQYAESTPDVWPAMEHPPGFNPYSDQVAQPDKLLLESLCEQYQDGALGFLRSHQTTLEQAAGCPLSTAGIAAAALVDIGFDHHQAEMLYLLLRLPGAAAHTIEQREYGWRQYPFFAKSLNLIKPER